MKKTKKHYLSKLYTPFLLFSISHAAVFQNTPYKTCFTPGENCTRLLTDQIYKARKNILIQAYILTSYPIIKALRYKYRHGVKIQMILDKSQFINPIRKGIKIILKTHIPIWVDPSVNIAHNKTMVIDNQTVETGSFNYTYSAQHFNAENILIIHNKQLAKKYIHYFNQIKGQSLKYNSKKFIHFIQKTNYLNKSKKFN